MTCGFHGKENSLVCLENNAENPQFIMKILKIPKISKRIISDCFNLHLDEWYSHGFHFFKDGTFPKSTTRNVCNHIRKLATHYIILGDMLYKFSYEGLLLRCLNRIEILTSLLEPHTGSCGGNFVGKSLDNKLLRMGYYWQMMEKYSFMFFKKMFSMSTT